MATLVCNYLRHIGFKVFEGSVFNGYYLINKLKPKVFFITNTVGADINCQLVKYAKNKEIPCATLISEGNFKDTEKFMDEFVWGWNKDKILYEDLHMQWSERSRNLTIKFFPELKTRIKVSGAVGFDVYKIKQPMNHTKFSNKYKINKYERIVGVGCYDFGPFQSSDHRFHICMKIFNQKELDRFNKDKYDFNKCIKEVILLNKDILFLLKEHPGSMGGHQASGIDGVKGIPNVLILKNEESIGDCISVSDFWLVYESTTSLEAWLLSKQTCLLNPSGTDFKRDNTHQGSPNFPDTASLHEAIQSFYQSGEIPGFLNLKSNRDRIIQETIQWDDGFNHVRAGNEIIDLIINEEKPKRQPISRGYKKEIFKQTIQWYLSPYLSFLKKFEFYADRRKAFDKEELRDFQEKCMTEQIAFYEKNNLTKDDLRMIRCI